MISPNNVMVLVMTIPEVVITIEMILMTITHKKIKYES